MQPGCVSENKGTESANSYESLKLDPSELPTHLSTARRWTCTIIVSSLTAVYAFAASIHSAAIDSVATYFHCSRIVSTLAVSTYLIGFGSGPLVFAPLSEVYGRNPVYRVSLALFIVFNLACALAPTIESLLVFRFLCGFFGSPSVSNTGGSLADMWKPEHRSVPLTLYTAASFVGPVLAPTIAGFLSQYTSWRWIYWLVLILSGFVYVVLVLVLPETYPAKLLQHKANRLGIPVRKPSLLKLLKGNLVRPCSMLVTEPILFLLSLYMAFLFGVLYLDFTAYPQVFQQTRHWQSGIAGLAFLGIAVGMLTAAVCSPLVNKVYNKYVKKLGGQVPEARLPHLIVLAWLVPAGLFWFAWTSAPPISWASCVVAGVPFGFGFVLLTLGIISYLVDCYGDFAASALAANTVLRALFGAGFPLFSRQMYNELGTAWATSLLAFIAVAMTPLPWIFYRYGPWLRSRSNFHKAAMQDKSEG